MGKITLYILPKLSIFGHYLDIVESQLNIFQNDSFDGT